MQFPASLGAGAPTPVGTASVASPSRPRGVVDLWFLPGSSDAADEPVPLHGCTTRIGSGWGRDGAQPYLGFAEGIDGWVMQCPASRGAGAPTPVGTLSVASPSSPRGWSESNRPSRDPVTRQWPRPPSRVRHAHRIEMGP